MNKVDKLIAKIQSLGFKLISSKHSRTCEYMFEHISNSNYRYATYSTNYVRYLTHEKKYYTPQIIAKDTMTLEARLEKLLIYLTKMKKLNRLTKKNEFARF